MAIAASNASETSGATKTSSIALVIAASTLGTLIEWYDFFIFGSLTTILSVKFYPPGNDTFALIAYLATFAVGFVARPFGALFFGRIGDMVGRKNAFLATLAIMGGSTAAIGLMPTFRTAGWFAPVTLIFIRVLQGLALGGEYGGAAVYLGEYSPDGKRGFYTSFIQITAALGLMISLLVILATQFAMTPEKFSAWGWRLPFLFSLILVGISLYVRLKLRESPIFSKLKAAGKTSAHPLRDAFGNWPNLKLVLITLFGAAAGQGVVSYTAEFYSLFYMQTILRLNTRTANVILAAAIALSFPFFIIFGALSDKIGRKKVMMAGFLIAALTFTPIYHAMVRAAGNHVVSVASMRNSVTGAISVAPMTRGANGAIVLARDAADPNVGELIFLNWLQLVFFAMTYGPIAAYLVEAFPARVRYTSLSLPYHIGNGVFGGLLPLIGLSICAATGNIYAGLYYPIAVSLISFVVGSLALRETHGTKLWDELSEPTV
ncbi:MAG TPA: MFS transporter [Candidatus Acidoferrales bacterium]|nr:MFS transporter [Candidatus Acidoferrales bacterium]